MKYPCLLQEFPTGAPTENLILVTNYIYYDYNLLLFIELFIELYLTIFRYLIMIKYIILSIIV